MKVLLTGSNGFLGKIIKDHFLLGKIITVGRNNTNIICDFSISTPSLIPVDLVIHVGGKAHSVPKTLADKQAFFDVNVRGTSNLLKGIENSGIPKSFVFISSVSVYGKENGDLIKENDTLLAKDPYGLSKIEAENLVLNWCDKYNVICTILRLPLIAGPNPPGNLGAMIKGIQKGYYFNIAGGQGKKSMVLAEDVVKNILKISEIGGIYNLTDGYHPSFSELSSYIAIQLCKGKPMNIPIWLAKIIAKFGDLLGSKAPINTNKLKKITSDLTFDDTKAREAFGWNPTRVLEGFKIH
jgi:nucleoside-diphosphate-sugar epimerase